MEQDSIIVSMREAILEYVHPQKIPEIILIISQKSELVSVTSSSL